MGFSRRSDRPDPARRGLRSGVETLEGRALLTLAAHPFSPWIPTDLPVTTAPAQQKIAFSIDGLVAQARQNPQAQFINNEGKVVSGRDRQGDIWTITVHGPGTVIVTDTTPNDGELDDNINTIQLVGTDPHSTYVTGNTTASNTAQTNGTVLFDKLIDTKGVKSVVLNGFTLAQTATPTASDTATGVNLNTTGVYLLGGVGLLEFHDILAPINTGTGTPPINVIIGDPSTPLTVAPTIKLDSIFNTVFNTTAATLPSMPQTTGTVNIVVNGQLRGLDIISATQHPTVDPAQLPQASTLEQSVPAPGATAPQPALGNPVPLIRTLSRATTPRAGNETNSPIANAGQEFQFRPAYTTGRTSVRALGIDHLNVKGSAINLTASRGTVPFQNGLSSLDHLGTATFGGNADGVGLDVSGRINYLIFKKGLGNPNGTSASATELGTPTHLTGFPSAGLIGGQVAAHKIRHVIALPANTDVSQVSTNPEFVQLNGQGEPTVFPRHGNALTSAAIVSAGDIGHVTLVGNSQDSEVKSGFDYPSFAAGLEGTRAASKIQRFRERGDLIDAAISSTYRPSKNTYGTLSDVAGPGSIKGNLQGSLIANGGTTPLLNTGAGVFARKKVGSLPPPEGPKRNAKGILIR